MSRTQYQIKYSIEYHFATIKKHIEYLHTAITESRYADAEVHEQALSRLYESLCYEYLDLI